MNSKFNKILFSLFACLFVQFISAQDYKLSLEDRPVYKAKKTTNKIKVDGKLCEKDWKKAEARTLDYHYLSKKTDDKQKTTFRMLWDDKTLYLFYESEDKYLTSTEKKHDGTPFLDDCAELFLIPVPNSLSMHYCFEVNLYGAKNDIVYMNNYYNGKDAVVKAFNPDYKVKVKTKGTINNNSDIDTGWTMEIAIPIEAFRGSTGLFPLKNGTQWAFLALRQERNDLEQGRRVMSSIFPIYDIEKDVHQPNMFGLVEFVD